MMLLFTTDNNIDALINKNVKIVFLRVRQITLNISNLISIKISPFCGIHLLNL